MAGAIALSAMANSKLSAYSQSILSQIQIDNGSNPTKALHALSPLSERSVMMAKEGARKTLNGLVRKTLNAKTKKIESDIDAFIVIDDDNTMQQLEQLGVQIAMVSDDFCTARIPLNSIQNVLELEGVKQVEFGRKAILFNDKVREAQGVNLIHQGYNLPRAYEGNGVLYGTFDGGIDYNHIAFFEENGNSRWLGMLDFDATIGGRQFVGNYYYLHNGNPTYAAFPGREFNASELRGMTCDFTSMSHGTHTIGTGCGSFKGNVYYGMAPKAQILGTSTATMTDVAMANGVAYVMAKADAAGKPCVMNLSMGLFEGPHDGKSFYNRVVDRLVGPGKVVVMSAGNSGGQCMHLKKKMNSSSDLIKTVLCSEEGDYWNYSGTFDAWGNTGKKFSCKLRVLRGSDGALLQESPAFNVTDGDTSYNFANSNYFSGYVYLSGWKDPMNGKYNIYGTVNVAMNSYDYNVAVVFQSAEGEEVEVWCGGNGLQFLDGEFSSIGYVNGTREGSISELDCSDNVISVGSYCSRLNFPHVAWGDTWPYSSSYVQVGQIAPYSSWGPDANNITRPDVCSPGCFVVSAVMVHDPCFTVGGEDYAEMAYNSTVNGRRQPYAWMSGTSMAAPNVAGSIATWLEADPTLTASKIRQIIKSTSKNDGETAKNPQRWGAGKFDAYAGLKEVLKQSSVSGVISDEAKPSVIYPNPSNGVFTVTVPNATDNVTVNVFAMDGTLVATKNIAGGTDETIDVSDKVSDGIYLVNIISGNNNETSRIVVRK